MIIRFINHAKTHSVLYIRSEKVKCRLLQTTGKYLNIVYLFRSNRNLLYFDVILILNVYVFLSAEIEAYKILDPATRLVVLKAICDIRVEVCFYIVNNFFIS